LTEIITTETSSSQALSVELAKAKASPTARRERSVDLIGVLMVMGLTFFHGAMPYAGMFYVAEKEINPLFLIFMGVFVLWAMPMLFYNAGRATWYNLGKRKVKGFLWERTKRLLIPFIVGTILFSPLLAWIALSNLSAKPLEALLDWRTYFTSLYPQFFNTRLIFSSFPFIFSYILNPARFNFFHIAHLWFLYSLFVIAVLLLPILILIRKKKDSKALKKFTKFIQKPGMIFLPVIPITLIEVFSNAPLGVRYGTWSGYSFALFFLFGFLFATNNVYREVLRKHWLVALIISITLFEIFLVILLRSYLGFVDFGFTVIDMAFVNPSAAIKFVQLLKGLSSWFLLIAVIGFFDKTSSKAKKKIKQKTAEKKQLTEIDKKRAVFKEKVFKYLQKAQLPYYIIHFPVLAVVAFFIVPLNIPVLLEYLILCLITLIISLGIYDLAIRRLSVTRFLFGVKEDKKITEGQDKIKNIDDKTKLIL
jgi:multidrug transporter EmrE-like cation transporter